MSKHDASHEISEARRRGIRRTAWVIGLVAAGVYVVFMLSAVMP